MRFRLYFTMRGLARTVEIPNKDNPVECTNLASLLAYVATNLPENKSLNLEAVGIRVELVEDAKEI